MIKYKKLNKITNEIIIDNPLQKKKILKQFSKYKKKTLNNFEELLEDILKIGRKWKFNEKQIAKFYNNFCLETIQEQFYLKKYNTYRAIKEKKTNLSLYNSNYKMKKYMIALMLTQIYWQSHVKIFKWYKEVISKLNLKTFLEIGSGHGLLTKELLKKKKAQGLICDISQQSLNLTKSILKNYNKKNEILFKKKDFLKFNDKKKYDLIIMGEVIEHVENPIKFLKKVKKLLSSNGKVFISTCANCAQVDHKYHFRNIDEIRMMILKSDLNIDKELVSASENIPKCRWQREKISVNYCALLSHENT